MVGGAFIAKLSLVSGIAHTLALCITYTMIGARDTLVAISGTTSLEVEIIDSTSFTVITPEEGITAT